MASRGSYPHPVLDGSDDVSSEFLVLNPTIDVGVDHVSIMFDVRCDDPDLRRLLENGGADIAARWKCSATMRNGQLQLEATPLTPDVVRYSAVLDHQQLDGLVTVFVTSLATEVMPAFSFSRQHHDYGQAVFEIGKGDLLANGGTFSFDAKKKYDPMSPPLESCFRFVRRSDNKRFVKVNTSGDEFVEVSFPPKVYDDFASGFAPTIQMSTVVVPALMHALEELKRSDGPAPTPGGWRTTISQIIEDKKLGGRDSIEIAQAILEDPIAAAFKQLTSMGAFDD